MKTVLRSSVSLSASKTEGGAGDEHHFCSCSFDLARGLLSDSVHEVKKLHVKCHFYCTRTIASVTPFLA